MSRPRTLTVTLTEKQYRALLLASARKPEEWGLAKNRWGDQLRTAHFMIQWHDGWGALCGVQAHGFTQPYASPAQAGGQPCQRCQAALRRRG